MLATGWLGRKPGRGFYDYVDAGPREASGQLRLSAVAAQA